MVMIDGWPMYNVAFICNRSTVVCSGLKTLIRWVTVVCLVGSMTVWPRAYQPDIRTSQVVSNIWTYPLHWWTDDDVCCNSGLLHWIISKLTATTTTVWVKKIPRVFLTFFPKWLEIFSPNFTCLLYIPTYAGLHSNHIPLVLWEKFYPEILMVPLLGGVLRVEWGKQAIFQLYAWPWMTFN